MGQLTIRGTSADLPVFDEEMELVPVSSLAAAGGSVSGFEFGGASMRDLDVTDARLHGGRIRAVRAERASMSGVRVRSAELTGCELGSLRWTGGRVSRARFDACRLLGARFEGVAMEHVIFTGCRLDYARFDGIRAAGPVLFVRCSLREAQFTDCSLAGCLFDGCDLFQAGFGQGFYRGCDLRGNDLSAVTGAQHLRRAVIDRVQLPQLAEALAAELELAFGDDPPGGC